MKRYWLALAVSVIFYARMDIFIWQRIFEANELKQYAGIYHWGWLQSLIGFMVLGVLLCYPNLRMMITFPISLAILAFSGLEDVLYYWLDGKPIHPELTWLNSNPLIIHPVTNVNLVISVIMWISVVVIGNRLLQEIQFQKGSQWIKQL